MSEPPLEVAGLGLRFGGVQALRDVDVRIPAGSICGLVGPNGAGKTSLFNCVCGYYRPTAGTIRALFDECPLTDLSVAEKLKSLLDKGFLTAAG